MAHAGLSAAAAPATARPPAVRLVEVGARDGLQNEPRIVPTAAKLALIDGLAAAGLRSIEATAFVSPRWVPQMADHAELMRRLQPRPGVSYPVLVPNLMGLEAAIAAGAREVAVFASASESFARRNTNCSIADSLHRFELVLASARQHGVRVRAYVSCALGCPYEGRVAPEMVAEVAVRLFEMGCYEIALSDTIGTGTPGAVRSLFRTVADYIPMGCLAGHFHDTYGQALANVLAALELGVNVFDSSIGGLGGCPYAAGASGNLATEDLVYMLEGMGVDTGVDLDLLLQAGEPVWAALGATTRSRAGLALAGRRRKA